MASISISNDVRLEIVEALTRFCHEHDVESTKDIDLADIEGEILYVLLDRDWVPADEAGEAAEGLAPQFDDLACERY